MSNENYAYIRENGWLPILLYLARKPSGWITAYELSGRLRMRTAGVYRALTHLFEAGLVQNNWIPSGRYPLRVYSIAPAGLAVVEQLNT